MKNCDFEQKFTTYAQAQTFNAINFLLLWQLKINTITLEKLQIRKKISTADFKVAVLICSYVPMLYI